MLHHIVVCSSSQPKFYPPPESTSLVTIKPLSSSPSSSDQIKPVSCCSLSSTKNKKEGISRVDEGRYSLGKAIQQQTPISFNRKRKATDEDRPTNTYVARTEHCSTWAGDEEAELKLTPPSTSFIRQHHMRNQSFWVPGEKAERSFMVMLEMLYEKRKLQIHMMGQDHYVRVAGDKNQCGAVFEVSGTTIIQGIGEFMLFAQA